ncbi:TPA: alpha/beta hydrolase [Pseudomonas aeruginosa]|nr:alpha/beta hydrolase [Pseudomonas aeruginosa]HCL4409647.1 alpha/beta hydrolase [Pseudomonas aeruginosa]
MTMNRLDVEFLSEGSRCKAWLYLPKTKKPAPVIVMAHGLGSTRVMRLGAYAERFRDLGYACLVFDYRHFGDSEGEPRQLLDVNKQLQDWKAAIAFARTRTDVDTDKVVLWGTSFSGGHVIATAADDQRVAAVISQCPFTDGMASSMAVPPLTSIKVTIRALTDKLGSWFGAAPVTIALAGKPGSTAMMSAPDCERGYLQLVPDAAAKQFPNYVAARIALQILCYFPGRKTPQLNCPTLFCICETDTVAPAKATLRHARRAPRGQIKIYKEGHFDIYLGDSFERTIGDQIDFLQRTVPLN